MLKLGKLGKLTSSSGNRGSGPTPPAPIVYPSFRIEEGYLFEDNKNGKVPWTYRLEGRDLIVSWNDPTPAPNQEIRDRYLIAIT